MAETQCDAWDHSILVAGPHGCDRCGAPSECAWLYEPRPPQQLQPVRFSHHLRDGLEPQDFTTSFVEDKEPIGVVEVALGLTLQATDSQSLRSLARALEHAADTIDVRRAARNAHA